MTSSDRAIRLACQGVVLLWIVSFLCWRGLAPREVRVPVNATAIVTEPLPEEPEVEAARPPAPEQIAARAEPESTVEPAAAPPAGTPPAPLAAVTIPELLGETDASGRELDPAAVEREVEREVAEREIEREAAERAAEIAHAEPPKPREAAPVPAPRALAPTPVSAPTPRAAPPAPVPAPAPALAAAAVPAVPPARGEPAPDALPVRKVDESDVARGGALLGGEGGFPPLETRYESYGSFRQYADAMRKLGAQFVVVRAREIVGTIDPWTLETGALSDPAGLSPRARDFAGEPELVRASRAVRREHGTRAEVMLLVPRRIDAGLFGGIARALEAAGREPSAYRQIRARYERGPSGGLRLRVESAVRRDGREEPLPLLFDLDGLAGRSRA